MRLKFSSLAVTIALFLCIGLSLERRAYGYVDPGSGLLILQGVGTVLTGVIFTLRRRIKTLFVRSKPADSGVSKSIAPATEV